MLKQPLFPVTKFLLTALTALAAGHIAVKFFACFGYDHLKGVSPLLDMSLENNLPNAFSALLMLGASLLFIRLAAAKTSASSSGTSQWIGLAVVFVWLALDEWFSLHDPWNNAIKTFLNTTGAFPYVWQLPYAALLALALPFYWNFFQTLPETLRRGLLTAAAVYLSGVIVCELAEGFYASAFGWQRNDMILMTIILLEETLEMLGLIILVNTLMRHVRTTINRPA